MGARAVRAPGRGARGADAPSRRRCTWARDGLDIRYHDEEWGVPVHDDRLLFELNRNP